MVSIGPKIQITGEDSYRLALRRIIQETKELNSEMDLMVSAFDKNASALDKTTRKHELYAKQIEATEKQNVKIVEGLEKANQKHQDAIKAYDEQKKKVAALESEQKRLVATMDSLEKAGSKGSATWNGLNQQLEANKAALEAENKELVKASDEVERSGRVLADWQATANNAAIELNELNKGFKDTSLAKAWGEQFQEVGEKMSDFGEKLSTYVTLPLTALGAASVKAAADFEDGMAKIYTIAVDSTEPMEKMRSEIIQLSNDTGFALDDLAEATYQTVSASVDATEAVDFMTQATKLARAGFTTTTKAVDVLTTVMNSYGKETYDVQYISDVLLKTQNDGKLVIDELASSLGIIIPMASNYHVGLEQIAAAYATMTKQGVPASKATTFLRAVFTELEKESSDVADILDQKTGKSFAQLMNEGKSLSYVLGILYEYAGKDTEAFQRLFGNVRATQAVAALVTEDFGILNHELRRVADSAGQTDKALEVMETPALKAQRAINRLKNTSVDIGETIIQEMLPAFEKVVDGVKSLTDGYMGLSDETKNHVVNTAMFIAAIGPGITILGKAVTLVGSLLAGTVPLINVIGALAGAYVGIGVAAQVAIEAHNNEIAAEWGLNQEMQTSIQTIENLKTSKQELLTSIEEEKAATEGQIATAQELITQYNGLVDENGKIKEGSEGLADVILNQLAQALGMERSEIEQLIEKNGQFGQSIDDTIAKIRQRAEMAAYEKLYQDAIERKTAAEAELEKQEGALTDAVGKSKIAHENTKAAYEAMIRAQQEGRADLGMYEQAWRDAVQAESEAKAAEDTLRSAVQDTKTMAGEAAGEVTVYGKKIEEATRKSAETVQQESAKTNKKLKDDSKDTGEAVKKNLTIDTSTVGYYMMTGLAGGIAKWQYLAERAAANAGYAASKALNNSVQVKSPSRVTAETGKYFVEGFANAIQSGINEMSEMGWLLGQSAANGLSMGSYMPEYGSVTKNVTAPISINVNVNGNVDDPNQFARELSDQLADILYREKEVFA